MAHQPVELSGKLVTKPCVRPSVPLCRLYWFKKSLKEQTSLVFGVALATQEVSEVFGLERLEDLRDGGVEAALVDGPGVGADALHDLVRRLGGEEDGLGAVRGDEALGDNSIRLKSFPKVEHKKLLESQICTQIDKDMNLQKPQKSPS